MSSKQQNGTGDSHLSLMAKQCVEDSERWFGDNACVFSVSHHALAMAGEVGEFCNIVKKIERGSLNSGDSKVRYDLAMELTDVFTYLLNLAGLMGIDLEKSYQVVRNNNEKRFMEQRTAREAKND